VLGIGIELGRPASPKPRAALRPCSPALFRGQRIVELWKMVATSFTRLRLGNWRNFGE
jgi:hypothetical protein